MQTNKRFKKYFILLLNISHRISDWGEIMVEGNEALTSLCCDCTSKISYPTTNRKKLYNYYSVLLCSIKYLYHSINCLYDFYNQFSIHNQYWLELNHYWCNSIQQWINHNYYRLNLIQYRYNSKEYRHNLYRQWRYHYQHWLYSNHKWLFKQHLFDILNKYLQSCKYFFYSLDKNFYKLIFQY